MSASHRCSIGYGFCKSFRLPQAIAQPPLLIRKTSKRLKAHHISAVLLFWEYNDRGVFPRFSFATPLRFSGCLMRTIHLIADNGFDRIRIVINHLHANAAHGFVDGGVKFGSERGFQANDGFA